MALQLLLILCNKKTLKQILVFSTAAKKTAEKKVYKPKTPKETKQTLYKTNRE